MSKRLIPALLVALMVAGAGMLAGATALATDASGGHGRSDAEVSPVCSPDDRGSAFIHPAATRRGAVLTMVPKGATDLTVCAYNGSDATASAPEFGLVGIGVTDNAPTLRRLTRELDAIRPTPSTAHPHCPSDDRGQEALYFGYRTGRGVVVTVGTGGCNAITNTAKETVSVPDGAGVQRYLGLGKPIIGQIAALVGPVKMSWAHVVGHFRLCGGPAPGRCYTERYTSCARYCMSADRVEVIGASDVVFAAVRTRSERFRFELPASGHYSFLLPAPAQTVTGANCWRRRGRGCGRAAPGGSR